ncbi:hypothetical protein ABZP36_034339 [Zizania latifolia]
MSSHEFHEDAANHVEVEPAGVQAADRHDDIAATEEALNDELWLAMLVDESEMLENMAAAGERPAGGARADFFADALAEVAREYSVQRYVPPPARSGFRSSLPRSAASGAGSSCCTPHSADIPVLPPGSPTTHARRAADLAMAEIVRETALPANALAQPQHQSAGVGADTPAVVVGKTEKGHGKVRNDGPVSSKRRAMPADSDTPAVFHGMEEGHGNVRNDDPVSSKRRAMLADSDSPAVFAGMEEGHDNAWYESIIRDVVIHEQDDDPELHGSIPQDLTPRSETPAVVEEPDAELASGAGGEGGELSLPKFYKKWGLRPSDLDPEDAGPSIKRRQRVPPVADGDLPVFDCGICLETLPLLDLFRGLQCGHKFCLECVATYVEGKVREGDVPIHCPDPECRDDEDGGVLHPEDCKKVIDFAAFGDWGMRLAEGAISPNRRAYCPNRRCRIMLETSGEEKPAQAPCPACNLLLCAACGMEWTTSAGNEHECAKSPGNVLMKKLTDEQNGQDDG